MDESKKKDRYEDAKKFVRYSDGAKMYSMGMTKFQEVQFMESILTADAQTEYRP